MTIYADELIQAIAVNLMNEGINDAKRSIGPVLTSIIRTICEAVNNEMEGRDYDKELMDSYHQEELERKSKAITGEST